MINNDDCWDCSELESKTEAWIACFNCGKPVKVLLPFIGCVYCEDCSKGASNNSIGTEDFTPSWQVK